MGRSFCIFRKRRYSDTVSSVARARQGGGDLYEDEDKNSAVMPVQYNMCSCPPDYIFPECFIKLDLRSGEGAKQQFTAEYAK